MPRLVIGQLFRFMALVALWLLAFVNGTGAAEPRWLAHWPLEDDFAAARGEKLDLLPANVVFEKGADGEMCAVFNGRTSALATGTLPLSAQDDFTLMMRIHVDEQLDDDPGDLFSCFDERTRRGILLSLRTHSTTSSLSNRRQLQFGIDSGTEPTFRDEGRPGKALVAFALCVHEGGLYASTCEPEAGGAGRVYRYAGTDRWVDLGQLDGANSVTSLASFDGYLYAGTGKYRLAGSSLAESPNEKHGGSVFRLESDGRWTDCGKLPETEAIKCLAVYRGKLFASSLYKPAGFFRYEGGQTWTALPVPDGRRVEALAVYEDKIFATSYDHGHVYAFDGEGWEDLGQVGSPEENTQTYSLVKHRGDLCVATWRSGKVYRFSLADKKRQWLDSGRLGEELEVMGLLVHNGMLYGGTLPLAELYRLDGTDQWTRLAQLDQTPDVRYRRVWTMAQYQGRLFCSTLPSGKIHSMQAGAVVTHDRPFPSGWQHIAAVRAGDRLQLYVGGKLVAESEKFDPQALNAYAEKATTKIGDGPSKPFRGKLRDVRVYQEALIAEAIAEIARGSD